MNRVSKITFGGENAIHSGMNQLEYETALLKQNVSNDIWISFKKFEHKIEKDLEEFREVLNYQLFHLEMSVLYKYNPEHYSFSDILKNSLDLKLADFPPEYFI